MIEIQKHGAVLHTDPDGYLIPDVSLDNIVPPWDEAVDFIKNAYIGHLGESLHSVYIRGSVARGLAVEGISDLDSFALARGYPSKMEGVKIGCRWICKRFLRAGMDLVLSRSKAFTRDLYYCYEEFAKFYPQQDAAMWQALEYAINPTGNVEELLPLVKELGDFLAQEADVVFGVPQNS